MSCPTCGGTSSKPIAPTLAECTSIVEEVVVTWQPAGPGGQMVQVPVTNSRVCGARYPTPGSGGPMPSCACGTFAVGTCVECGAYVCGDCSEVVDGRRLCHKDMSEARDRIEAATAAALADEHRRLREAEVVEEERYRALPVPTAAQMAAFFKANAAGARNRRAAEVGHRRAKELGFRLVEMTGADIATAVSLITSPGPCSGSRYDRNVFGKLTTPKLTYRGWIISWDRPWKERYDYDQGSPAMFLKASGEATVDRVQPLGSSFILHEEFQPPSHLWSVETVASLYITGKAHATATKRNGKQHRVAYIATDPIGGNAGR